MRRAISITTLSALVALAGCTKSEPTSDVPLENAAEACAAYEGLIASFVARCFGFTQEVAAGAIGADPAYDCAQWSAAVEDGTTTYDRASATTCLAAVGALTCNQLAWAEATGEPLLPYDCVAAMRGTLAAPSVCTHGFECASGICDLPAACDAPGTCVDAPGEGEPCAGVSPFCADGLVCDAGSCALPPPVPSPVETTGDCSAAPCVDSAYCRAGDSVCVNRGGTGDACSAIAPCAYDHACVGNICQPLVQPGGACTFGASDCALGASCVALSTMVPGTTCQGWGRAGAACGLVLGVYEGNVAVEAVGCVDSWCSATGVQGTCTAYTPVGDPCEAGTGECGPDNGYACVGGFCERLYCDPP